MSNRASITMVPGDTAPRYQDTTEVTLENVVITEQGTNARLPIVDQKKGHAPVGSAGAPPSDAQQDSTPPSRGTTPREDRARTPERGGLARVRETDRGGAAQGAPRGGDAAPGGATDRVREQPPGTTYADLAREMAAAGAARTLEEGLRLMKQTAELLESGRLTLEQSLELYELGVRVAAETRRTLEAAELRVTVLGQDGEQTDLPERDR